MRPPTPARAAALLLTAAALLAGCGTQSGTAGSTSPSDGAGTSSPSNGSPASASAAGAFAQVTLNIPSGNAGGGINPGQKVLLPRGWTAEVWARVSDARLEAWTPQGDLLVSQPNNGQVTELIPRPEPSQPPQQRVIISGLSAPQGLAFARLSGQEVLYVAEQGEVDRYDWSNGTVGARIVVAPNLPDTAPSGSDNHTLKNVVVGPGGRIYVDIGSGSNASPPGNTVPPRAAVVSYAANGGGMRVLATGIRNGDGLSFAPDGTLWTAVNERDQISYPFHQAYGTLTDAYGQVMQAYINNQPPDELARLTPGRNLGWPYCDPDPDVHPGVPGTPLQYGNLPFTDDQQTNPNGAALNCAKLSPLNRGLPAHSAPLGFHFLEGSLLPSRWTHGAVVAVHGSWDRQPPRAPAVLWLPWESGARTLGSPVTIVGGFQDAAGNRWGRPVDAVPGPDGALYVSDDTAGAIYRIVP
jgi:glucose/arabinose dehydrogenase